MLDKAITEQLQEHFREMGSPVVLLVDKSDHITQAELLQMVRDIAATSEHISVVLTEHESSEPRVTVQAGNQQAGIMFRGVPGGHEFTSFIVAILNAGGKGKLPDAALQSRIRRLRGGFHLQTYVSLSCENCPGVVQAMNQIALIHGNLTHETIDGGVAQEEIEGLGIQGVPSVTLNGRLIHSGRGSLSDLLKRLETELGVESDQTAVDQDLGRFDIVVLGGGPAGVSAAIYSVRKGLKTALVADRIGGQLQETKGVENFISVVYAEGPHLSANLHDHLRSYPVHILENRRAKQIVPNGQSSYRVEMDGGEHLIADTLLIATGSKWRMLGVPGEAEYAGKGVAYCPHCDGPYYRGKDVAVVGGGNSGVEAALDLAGICRKVTLVEYEPELKADRTLMNKLQAVANIEVITHGETLIIRGDGQSVRALRWRDRGSGNIEDLPIEGVFVQIGLSPNSEFIKGLVDINGNGEIITDLRGRTTMPGIYAAGDVTDVPYKQIVIALGEGAKAALAAFEDRLRR